MESGTAKVLVQIERTAGSLEAERGNSLPILSPVFPWRVTKVVDQNRLGDYRHVPGEVLPLSDKDTLAQYLRPGEETRYREGTPRVTLGRVYKGLCPNSSNNVAVEPDENYKAS